MASEGKLPKAAIVVDLYGQSADWNPIQEACSEFGVPVIEDAAEALGATYRDTPLGRFGEFGVFSFNGNKIITTSGGGMLVSEDEAAIAQAHKLASQAREDAPHYEHTEIGFNYRLSNVLAAIGRGQLRVLEDRIAARRQIFEWYEEFLADLPGVQFMPEAEYGRSTRWLTCLTIDPRDFGADREEIRLALEIDDIESRPVWKPMHMQPVFRGARVIGGSVAEELFEKGLCLPSGSAMSRNDVERISRIVRDCSVQVGA
jgi:pyridoxal phosphate-dependent aminotransferase EpsN